jgi:hypothetical protein
MYADKIRRFSFYLVSSLVFISIFVSIAINTIKVRGGVSVPVYGYVYMPDGSKAVGASVHVSGGGDSWSGTTDNDGYYDTTLNVNAVPVTVTVSASKGDYSGSSSGTSQHGEALLINVYLSAAPPPPPPPPPEKKPVSIQLNVPSEAVVNASVMITGKVSPSVSPVYFKVKDPKGDLKEYQLSVSSNGIFSFNFTPRLLGLYKVSAYFPRDAEYESASTPEYALHVKGVSILNLTVSPAVIIAGAEDIKINGTLYPPSAKNVSLCYSLDNISWTLFAELKATTGVFSMVWKPRVFGDVFIKAEWPGNDTYIGSVTYGRFQTVVPSVCTLRSWIEESVVSIGREIIVNGVLIGTMEPETAELTLHIYQGEREVKVLRLRPFPNGSFTISYRPESPGIYVLVLETSGKRLSRVSNFSIAVVLGKVTLRAVNSTGGLLDGVVELKHDGEVIASGSGELTATLALGDYEVSVKKDDVEVFKGSLHVTNKSISLNSGMSVEFPLPLTSNPLMIELKTKTYSLSVYVVNEFGEPMGGIDVRIASSASQANGKTDANGHVVFSNIPTGNYTVSNSVESRNVNLIRNESVILKGSGLSSKLMLILMAVALAVLCFATLYLARKKPVAEKK